jgi:hypothetical protein
MIAGLGTSSFAPFEPPIARMKSPKEKPSIAETGFGELQNRELYLTFHHFKGSKGKLIQRLTQFNCN